MLYLTNPAGVEIFSHVNTFVGFMLHILCHHRNLDQQNEKYTFQKQLALVLVKEKQDGTQHASKLQLSVGSKSRTHLVSGCLQGF